MLKPIKSEVIEKLTDTWMNWMKHHIKSNNVSLTLSERRKSGEECEKLQAKRQQLIKELND